MASGCFDDLERGCVGAARERPPLTSEASPPNQRHLQVVKSTRCDGLINRYQNAASPGTTQYSAPTWSGSDREDRPLPRREFHADQARFGPKLSPPRVLRYPVEAQHLPCQPNMGSDLGFYRWAIADSNRGPLPCEGQSRGSRFPLDCALFGVMVGQRRSRCLQLVPASFGWFLQGCGPNVAPARAIKSPLRRSHSDVDVRSAATIDPSGERPSEGSVEGLPA
jgi:hypothetical protein